MSSFDEPPRMPEAGSAPTVPPAPAAVPAPPGTYPAPANRYPVPPPATRSLTGLAIAIQILLGIQAILSGAAIWGAFDQQSLINRLRESPDSVSQAEADDSDSIVGAVNVVQVALYIATGVVWIVWLYRARKNTDVWDGRFSRWGAGWTIGAWFIPIFNLVGPALVTREIAQSSDEDDISGRRWPQPAVMWWGLAWAALLVVNAIDRFENRSLENNEFPTLDDIDGVLLWDIVSEVTALLAVVAAVVLVRSLTRRQTDRLEAGRVG